MNVFSHIFTSNVESLSFKNILVIASLDSKMFANSTHAFFEVILD